MPTRLLTIIALCAATLLASASATAQQRCPYDATGTLTATSTVQQGRLHPGLASACGTSKAVPAIQGAANTFRYAVYSLQNRSRAAACVTITLNVSAGTLQSAAYASAFDPNNPQTGYLADIGPAVTAGAASYGVTIPALTTFAVTVNATSATNASYTLDVTGCGAVVVTSVTPNSGPVAGGTPVTIAGSGFLTAPAVTFGGVSATGITLVDQGTIDATTPPGATGLVDVVVTNTDATTSTLSGGYQYNPPPATTVALTSSVSPIVYGQSVTFTASLSSGAGTPTGKASFYDGTTDLADVTLDASGKAAFTTTSLAPGSHAMSVQYAGNLSFAAGTSAVVNEAVSQGSTRTTLVSSKNPIGANDPVTFTATTLPVSPSSGAPTGLVAFTSDGAPIGGVTLDAQGNAALTTPALTNGSHTIVATYAGDAHFATSASAALAESVSLPGSGTTLASSANPSLLGSAITFTVSVQPTAGASPPTGAVTFLDDGTQIGTATLDATGTATFTTNALTLGLHPIVAKYGGDGANGASSSTALTQTIVAQIGDAGPVVIDDGGAPSVPDAGDETTNIDGGNDGGVADAGVTFIDVGYDTTNDACGCRATGASTSSRAAMSLGLAMAIALAWRRRRERSQIALKIAGGVTWTLCALIAIGCETTTTHHPIYVAVEVEAGAPDASCTSCEADGSVSPPPPSTTIPDPTYPTKHASIPLLPYLDGPILDSPQIVTVTFDGDASRDFLEQFGDTITSTAWWDAVSEGYCDSSGACVGHGAGAGHVHVSQTPASSYDDTAGTASSSLKQYIDANIQSGLFPAPNADTIYVVYFPDGVTITLDGMASCSQYGAYHNAMTTTPPGASAPVTFAFAVIPRCEDGQNVLTLSASHELIEASTDPVFVTAIQSLGGWSSTSDAWDYQYGGEAADRCVQIDSAGEPIDTYQEGMFLVQRSFSNTQAQASHDPCVPAISPTLVPYFNVAPETGDVLHLAVGQTITIPLTAFSDAPVPPFTLSVAETPADGESALDLSLDNTSVQNGQTVYLSITLKADVPSKIAPFAVTSTLGPWSHAWPFLVREGS